MQGPRLLSHSADSRITLQRLERPPPQKDPLYEEALEADKSRIIDDDHQRAQTPPRSLLEDIRIGDDTGGTASQGTATDEDGRKPDTCRRRRPSSRISRTIEWGRRHLRFIGPGLIASAAYLDPGNYATNLQAGATNGYKLLFIVLLSGLIGIMMQILAARLGIVTGKDIAQLCRETLHSRPRHTLLYRWGMLYPLYIIAEAGIIFTDLAELLGTAIAFNLLIPKIPLYAGVLLTSLDVFVVLAVFNSYPNETRNKSITAFEILISVMVLTVLSSFVVLIVRLSPDWSDVFDGYLPSSAVVGPGALYISVGIIGATVMPHALFLGAKLGTIRRIEDHEAYSGDEEDANKVIDKDLGSGLDSTEMTGLSNRAQRSPRTNATHRARSGTNAHMHAPSLHMPQPTRMPQYPLKELPKTERSAKFIRIHLHHAQLDIGYSLFCFALVTNSAILTVAGAAFYYREGTEDTSGVQEGDLFSAHELIKTRVGTAFAFLFALALMMSGQAASITATLAGQVVSEGFIEWRTTPWKRRLITRCISMIPALVVAVAVGQKGVNTLLIASQVTLSLVLPFVLGPLVAFTCRRHLMSIPNVTSVQATLSSPGPQGWRRWGRRLQHINPFAPRTPPNKDTLTFANNYLVMALGWAIFAVICVADIYALVQLGLGQA